MKIFIEKTNITEEIELEKPVILLEILKELEINPETVIISRNNKLITQQTDLNNEDEIQILPIISGG